MSTPLINRLTIPAYLSVLDTLAHHSPLSLSQLHRASGVFTYGSVRHYVEEFVRLGVLVKQKNGREVLLDFSPHMTREQVIAIRDTVGFIRLLQRKQREVR